MVDAGVRFGLHSPGDKPAAGHHEGDDHQDGNTCRVTYEVAEHCYCIGLSVTRTEGNVLLLDARAHVQRMTSQTMVVLGMLLLSHVARSQVSTDKMNIAVI